MDDRVQQFLQTRRDQGFDPATAFVLYQELNAVAAPTVFNEDLASDQDRLGQAVLGRLREALEAVQSPEDWRTYCQNWVATADGQVSTVMSIDRKKALIRQLTTTWGTWVPHEDRDDLMSRMTSLEREHGVSRYLQASEGMTWERLEQVLQADRLDLAWNTATTSSTDADRALVQALTATSVRSVRWNWIDGDGAAQRATLAQGLVQGQQEMQHRTGWAGPVLGLNGNMRLSFGNEHAASGYAEQTADGSTLIVSSPKAGWGVVSHEWLHAFDQVTARAQGHTDGRCLSDDWSAATPLPTTGTVAQQQTSQAFNALLDHLMVQAPGVDVRAQGLAESQASWGERMITMLPWSTAVVAAETARMDDGTWTRATSSAAWFQGYRDAGREPIEAQTLAELVVTEIEFLKTAQTQHDGSVWREFIGRFDDNLIRHDLDQDYHGYFQLPAEVLAHSFESTFDSPSTLLTDVHAGHVGLRYPTAVEGRWQAQAWRTFFQTAGPGWYEFSGANPVTAMTPSPAILAIPSRQGLMGKLALRDAGNDEPVALAARVAHRPERNRL